VISENKQIKIGAILSYISVFMGIVSGLIFNPWMIHKIGDADYGLYTLAMSLINIFLVDFGLSMAAQRYVSKFIAEKNQQDVDNIVGLIFKLYLIITLLLAVVFVVLYFFVDGIYVKLTDDELKKFKALYVMVGIYSITSFPFITLNGILGSYEKFIPLKISDIIYKIITIVLTAIALFIGYGVYVLVVVNLFASIVITIIRIVFVKIYTPVKPNFSYKNRDKVKELFKFSIWTSVSVIISRLLLSLGPSILGVVSGAYEIAVFGYAVSIEGYIYSFVNAINGFFMPQLSRINTDSEHSDEQVLTLMISVGRYILMFFGLIFVGFAVLGKEFIIMLVGSDYIGAYYCVLLICGYGVIAYPQQIANTYTVVSNNVKDRAIISIISFVAYLISVFLLGNLFGAVGISLAICFSLVLQTVLMNVLYSKKLNIKVMQFFKKCHLRMLPGFMMFAFVSVAISFIPFAGWGGFAIKVFMITAIYMLFIWFCFMKKSERKKIVSLIKSKFLGAVK